MVAAIGVHQHDLVAEAGSAARGIALEGDFRSIRREVGSEVRGGVLGQVDRVAAVSRVDHEDFVVTAHAAANRETVPVR